MTFETKAVFAAEIFLAEISVLHSTSALHGPHDEAFGISEHPQRGGLELQRALVDFYWVEVLLGEHVIKVPNVDELLGVRCDHEGKFHAHVLNWLAHIGFPNLV